MEEQKKNNEGQNPMDKVLKMSANDMAKSVNANIGITAFGKAFFFSKALLEEISKKIPDGASLQIEHLIQICHEAGQKIADERFSISLISLDTTEEQWIASVNKPLEEYDDDDDYEDEDDCEDDDDYEDEDDCEDEYDDDSNDD